MNNIKISFCIPTYNRSGLLSELIESIVSQCKDRNDIEICISDNASDDNTVEMINNWINKTHISIVYNVNKTNLGADINFLLAPKLASGKYYWLFGSDDKLFPGAIDYLEDFLELDNDIYLVERTEYDFNFAKVNRAGRRWMATGSRIYNSNNKNELLEYFSNSISIGAVFSFLSSNIVKRARWEAIEFDDNYIGSAYPHVYILLSILSEGAVVNYINKPLVMCRGDNDHFSNDGVINRIELDFRGFLNFSDEFYSNHSQIKSKFNSILCHERPFLKTIAVVSTRGTKEEKERIRGYYNKLGMSNIVIHFIYLLKPLLRLSKYIRDGFLNWKIDK